MPALKGLHGCAPPSSLAPVHVWLRGDGTVSRVAARGEKLGALHKGHMSWRQLSPLPLLGHLNLGYLPHHQSLPSAWQTDEKWNRTMTPPLLFHLGKQGWKSSQ
ncbi:hypothetical protein XENTR_v10004093 [Xenopus tropicalis]|nr:hypothetical protein XENTR_v10004093 [Xenopus tropicalis]